jgi:serine/threonine-protein kinase
LIGRTLSGRYRIEKKLGEGGMGAVYIAHDKPELHARRVVVKVLLQAAAKNDYILTKFQQEIESLSRLDDPGVVGIFDAGKLDDGTPYIVMQYIDGTTLRAIIKPEGMDFRQSAAIMKQVGSSVTAAHQAGILHRDLKPENIMLRKSVTGEQVKIIDFGIAKVRNSVTGPSTATGMTAGTIGYMSPEQLSARPLTPASDVYALGTIAYEMLTGRKPFNPDSMFQLLEMQRGGVRIKPTDLRPSLAAETDGVILKALAFDPQDRFQQAHEFTEELVKTLITTFEAGTAETLGSKEVTRSVAGSNELPAPTIGSKPGSNVPDQSARQSQPLVLETAHVLLMDIVGYSTLLIDEQTRQLQQLQEIVRNAEEFKRAHVADQMIRLPTGDGMALVFFADPEAAMRCAVEVGKALRDHPEIRLRMGVNTGPVYRMADINANMNVAGGGINMAQRVMDCGETGHLIVSQRVADDLVQLSLWANGLHDLGEVEVKHGVRIHVYNFHTSEVGNPEVPTKLRVRRGGLKSRRSVITAVAVPILLILALGIAWFGWKWSRNPTTPVLPGDTASAPLSQRSFSYSMIVQKYRKGKPFQKPYTIPGEINFEVDDRIQLMLTASEQSYMYLVNKPPDNRPGEKCGVLFPDDGKSALIAPNQLVQIPAPSQHREEDWIGFDTETGTEELWIIWSIQPLPLFEAVKKWSNPKDLGEIKDAQKDKEVREFLEPHKSSKPEGKRNQEGTKTTVSGSGAVIVYWIPLQHH